MAGREGCFDVDRVAVRNMDFACRMHDIPITPHKRNEVERSVGAGRCGRGWRVENTLLSVSRVVACLWHAASHAHCHPHTGVVAVTYDFLFEELKKQCYSQLYDLKIINEDHSETVGELVRRMKKMGFEVSF